MPVEMPRNRSRRRHSEIYLLADYRALAGVSPDELRAARERYMLAGLDLDTFADAAARWMRTHKSLADFPTTGEPAP